MTERRPFGLWSSPLTADDVARRIRFSDVQWDSSGEHLVWLEQRSDQGVLVCLNLSERSSRDLTSSLSVRAKVGYGGGDFSVAGEDVYYVSDGRIYRQNLFAGSAVPITPAFGEPASPVLSPDGSSVVFVHTADDRDVLAVVDSSGAQWPQKLAEGQDFYMNPSWSPDGSRLAWIAWDHPNMPWDGTALYLAEVTSAIGIRTLKNQEILEGDPRGGCFISQPRFSPDGRSLAFLSDRTGFLCPWILDLRSGETRPLLEEEAEFGGPAWVQGMRSYGWSGDSRSLYLIRSSQSASEAIRFDLETSLTEVVGDLSYTALSQLAVSGGSQVVERLALIASSASRPTRVVVFEGSSAIVVRRSQAEVVPEGSMSRPIHLEIPSNAGTRCFGLYYPPCNPLFEGSGEPPAIINIHGGPTAQALNAFDPDVQFFTSRGFAFLDLNYRGSWGYGREFVNSLRGEWGIADVADVRAAARYLVAHSLADETRMVVSGGSAGGFTVLLCLARNPGTYRAGICRYGVVDLLELAASTHKFEAHYLDSLLGSLPDSAEIYRERSPIAVVDKINDAVAIYQGSDDQVVPRSQAEVLVQSLEKRGVPHVYELYEGEGHGFRKSSTIRSYYSSVERFLRKHVLYG